MAEVGPSPCGSTGATVAKALDTARIRSGQAGARHAEPGHWQARNRDLGGLTGATRNRLTSADQRFIIDKRYSRLVVDRPRKGWADDPRMANRIPLVKRAPTRPCSPWTSASPTSPS